MIDVVDPRPRGDPAQRHVERSRQRGRLIATLTDDDGDVIGFLQP